MPENIRDVYLKPCFLYLGIYDEDGYIGVSTLVELWVAEGFLKPIEGKSSEEVAEEYLHDLVDRNLVLVHKLGSLRNIKYIKIHDLVRDMCLRQARKERFYSVVKRHCVGIARDTHFQRRFIISDSYLKDSFYHALLSMPLLRSLICNFEEVVLPSPPHHRLVRIFEASSYSKVVSYDYHFLEKLVNLRRIFMNYIFGNLEYPFPLCNLWNLQTFTILDYDGAAAVPSEFWNMHNLRYVYVTPSLCLPNPPEDGVVLENLQTLAKVEKFKCGEELVRRIPNLKNFKVCSDVDLSFLYRLEKLESFYYKFRKPLNLTFPHSLKKLTLKAGDFYWEEVLEKIGSLPLLQKLTLRGGSFKSSTWETVEGHFPNLKVLELDGCDGFECWEMESSHFPRLMNLVLYNLEELNEIPSGVGEIQTLESIKLERCSNLLVISANTIQKEQKELCGEEEATLQVQVKLSREDYESLKYLASPNFKLNLRT